MARSRPYHHGDLRRALLSAAETTLEEEGLGAVGIRAIARKVGVSHAAPYHHFPNRAALVAAVATDGFVRLRDVMMEAGRGIPAEDPRGRLMEVGKAYALFAWDHPGLYRLMFGAAVRPERHEGLSTAGAGARAVLLEGLATLGLTTPVLEAVGRAAWSMVHGHALLLLDGQVGPPNPTREEVAALSQEVLVILGRGFFSGTG